MGVGFGADFGLGPNSHYRESAARLVLKSNSDRIESMVARCSNELYGWIGMGKSAIKLY